jgi:pimeloyl-ACP methyl ester carboxylesterase
VIADAVDRSELVIIPECGHFIASEAPDRFRAEIVRFCG